MPGPAPSVRGNDPQFCDPETSQLVRRVGDNVACVGRHGPLDDGGRSGDLEAPISEGFYLGIAGLHLQRVGGMDALGHREEAFRCGDLCGPVSRLRGSATHETTEHQDGHEMAEGCVHNPMLPDRISERQDPWNHGRICRIQICR